MPRISLFALLLAAGFGCTAQPPERQVINDAATAIGGAERILAARTLLLLGGGTQYNLGQDVTPGASTQTFAVSSLRRAMDIANARVRVEQTRTPNFLYFQGPAPQRQVQGVDGEVGYNIPPSGTAVRTTAQVAQDRRADFYHHPLTLLRAALAPGAQISNARLEGGLRLVDIAMAQGPRFVLAVDANDLPARIESRSYHPNLGDVTLSTHFADYQAVSGFRLPAGVTTKVDDFTIAELRFTTQGVDEELGDVAVPTAVASTPDASIPQPNVVAQDVAPGVWLLAGQSHHSALVEFSDHLMLIDAPQSEARTVAVIAKARELRPNKPLTQVVTTHHHFDHTAGIRAAVAEGLTIITHAGNHAFFEEMAKRPHTIVRDLLAQRPKAATIETVEDRRMISDNTMAVELHHVSGNPHSDTMLMAYIPSARVLVEVDAFSPGGQVNPYAANLLSNITKRNLAVDRIVPLHGAIVPFGELVKVVPLQTN